MNLINFMQVLLTGLIKFSLFFNEKFITKDSSFILFKWIG